MTVLRRLRKQALEFGRCKALGVGLGTGFRLEELGNAAPDSFYALARQAHGVVSAWTSGRHALFVSLRGPV